MRLLLSGYTERVIETYRDLTPDALALMGFPDPYAACRALQDLAGHNVPDPVFEALLRVLLPVLAESADPDRAAANLSRWAGRVGSRAAAYQFLASVPAAARVLVTVLAASQFFADLLIANPEYLETLTNPALRLPRTPDALWHDMSRRVLTLPGANGRRDALRRAKGPEVLRIGVRDLLGEADFRETVAQISLFADACVQMAWRIGADERGPSVPRMAVLAMGKLGGQELNYSSDIDLIFVHADDADAGAAIKIAENIQATLSRPTDAGFVFRVDVRLRPEGRFGPLSRSLSSCRAYYESWAEPWERQALLKVRPIAGDAELGAQFVNMVQPFVYGGRVEEDFVHAIRAGKRQMEARVARAGENNINVKEGVGGIRDVEFAVQLLQLLAGGANPAVRTGNTWDALARLTEAGLLTESERDTLRDGYVFLRDVEHRLQLLDEQAVRTLPRDGRSLNVFARRMEYPNGAVFMSEYGRQTAQVHALFTRLFDGPSVPADAPDPVREWVLAPEDAHAQQHLRDALTRRGFRDTNAALQLLRRDVAGSEYGGVAPEAREAFADVIGPLLDAAGGTSDLDAALRGVDTLAGAMPSRAAFWRTLAGSVHLLPRLCKLSADAPFLWQTLLTHLEFLDILTDEERMDTPLSAPPAPPDTRPALAAWLLRSRLTVGARDVWGLADTEQIMRETTLSAEAALSGALSLARTETGFAGRFAVIGLGRLGAGELSYGSDLDVVYVADAGELEQAARFAERVQSILSAELLPFGARLDVDARLRPEGRKGALVLDIGTYRKYYAGAETWERQVLIKARFVAGDADLGAEFVALARDTVYGQPITPEQEAAVRAMKRRIETERVHDPADVKLGPGGLSDVEWAAQLLQWRHGHTRLRLRLPGTLAALRALRDDARLTQADWEVLSDTFLALSRLRGRHFLRGGVASDVFPLPQEVAALRVQARDVFRRVFAPV